MTRTMKPKVNRKGSEKKVSAFDNCQTPPKAAHTLSKFIPSGKVIWESACGTEKMLFRGITQYLQPKAIIGTDLLNGVNFLTDAPPNFDIQITNPPYSIKYQWLKRSYELRKPFALLLPVETLGAKKAQTLFDMYGVEIILISPRINFYMPNLGFSGKGAQFPTMWVTHGLNIGQQISYVTYEQDKDFEQSYNNLKKAA